MKRLASAGVLIAFIIILGLASRAASPQSVTVAVATNFSDTLNALDLAFQRETGHSITAVSGSTGQLYAQIVNGAPFDILLAADQLRPSRLATTQFAVGESQFTYASGALALWSTRLEITPSTGRDQLASGAFSTLAIANPALAPYGLAALETLDNLNLTEALEGSIVRGENIGQTYLLVSTGNADLGLIALSQLVREDRPTQNSGWRIPATLHSPIHQDAILLRHGAENEAAQAFLTFLNGETARGIIVTHGYTVTQP
jgi:molybdate transport system substrate-binding protein